ncbi:MAG TPA: ABC-2 family transporter protein [Ktedonobacterales bacterium]|nr:ABC-2 family transporter protein [Ktedonobacterales bacterium]
MLRFYVEVARSSFRRLLIYRWANLAGMAANVFFGIIFCYVYIALFRARPTAAGFDLRDTLRYVWLMQALTMVVLRFSWYDLMLTIRSGEVIADLAKPCDFTWYWFSREAGASVYYLLYRCVPTYLAGMLLFGIGLPGEWRVLPAFALSLVFGTGLGIAFRFLYNVIAFWLLEARAVGGMASVVALFFAGTYVPLPFLPGAMRTIALWSPFSGMLNVPTEIFMGKLSGADLLGALLLQAMWLVALTLLARALTAAAARRVVVQGG